MSEDESWGESSQESEWESDGGIGGEEWGGSEAEEWEDGLEEDQPREDDELSEEEETTDTGRAGAALVRVLLSLLFGGKLSAKMVCSICWWAWRSGSKCPNVKRMAYKPSSPSGHFQRHIDRVLGVSTKNAAYRIDLPLYTRGGIARRQISTPVELGYERMLEEIEEHPTFEHDLARAAEEHALPPSYYSHEAQTGSILI